MCSGGTTGVSCILKSMVDVTPQSCLWGNGPLQTSRFQCCGNLSDVSPYFHFRSGCACLCMFGQCSTYCWRRTVCVCICLVKAVHAVRGSACLGEAVHERRSSLWLLNLGLQFSLSHRLFLLVSLIDE